VRVALVGDEKQIGHEYVCRGSGFGGKLDGGGKWCALELTLAIMGDVGGAVCDLGGGVIEGGRSTVIFGSEGVFGRDGADWDESVFEWVKPSSRPGDPDRWGSYNASQQGYCQRASHTFTRLSTPAASGVCLGVMSEDALSSKLSCLSFFLS
jgi:hypothetical protein